jgi:hypothetical protein
MSAFPAKTTRSRTAGQSGHIATSSITNQLDQGGQPIQNNHSVPSHEMTGKVRETRLTADLACYASFTLSPCVSKHMCPGQPNRVPGGSILALRKIGGSSAALYGCLLYADISGARSWERGWFRSARELGRRRMAGGAADSRGGRRRVGWARRGWGAPRWADGGGADEGSAVMRGRVTEDERTERARDEGTGGGRRRRRWSLPANATRTRTRRRGGRRRRWAAWFRRSAGSPRGG